MQETASYPSYPVSYLRDVLNESTSTQTAESNPTLNEAQTSDNTSLLTIGFIIIVVSIIAGGLYLAFSRGKKA